MSKSKSPVIERKAEWLTIYPSLSVDTVGGKPVTSGSLFMQIYRGDIMLEHKGKTVKIGVGSMGGTFILSGPQRQCKLNLERFVNEAITHGLLEETIDFDKPTKATTK